MATQVLVQRRLSVLARWLNSNHGIVYRTCSSKSAGDRVSIGEVNITVRDPANPEFVPHNYLPKSLPKDVLRDLKWIMQKDLLGQDVFLLGRPGPLRRSVLMQYLELTKKEVEYVALSRDTTESDLKQRREIKDGSAHYIDQSAVKAATEGRILVLEGIEKAERNVLPVLNNLLENREMHLEDGRLLIPASRYDKLLEDHSQAELDAWKLERVSEDFRVFALGLPVPKYVGNPLDPPLRSRFQARDIRHVSYTEQLEALKQIGGTADEVVTKLLSISHTLLTDESASLGLPDFPVENLPAVIEMISKAPNLNAYNALIRLYPYKAILPKEGVQSVEDTLGIFHMNPADDQLMHIENIRRGSKAEAFVQVKVDNKVTEEFAVPAGPEQMQSVDSSFVRTAYHECLVAEMLLSHAVKDFCVIGPKGCGKNVVVDHLANLLGYDIEPIMLYADMTARDLLQQRTTMENGDTVWRYSPLVIAALEGKMAVLDGVHRIHRGTLTVLHRLVHDREIQLYDGSRLLRSDRFDAIQKEGGYSEEEMTERRLLKIHPAFRIAALAEPPSKDGAGGANGAGQWLTPEVLSMFLFHTMRPLNKNEELFVLKTRTTDGSKQTKEVGQTVEEIVRLAHKLRSSADTSLQSISNSLSTRQLLRISNRLQHFPNESVYHAVHKACLARFLPSLARETLEKVMTEMGIEKTEVEVPDQAICKVEDGILTIGTTTAKIHNPDVKTKIPETLFYDTAQNITVMEGILQDFLLGEHLLLVGNQGVGKNKVVDRMLNLLNRPREYIQLHRDTTVQSLTLQPTVLEGVIKYEDSPLVKAVKTGHVLVVDEADKAPTNVTCILKTLVESGEMILSDGRRIVPHDSTMQVYDTVLGAEQYIRMHPDFRMIVLANRPGFPFLGNDFFGSLGDLFSCHAIDNPSMASEMAMLRCYGPDVPEDILRRLVKAFSELRNLADEGQIQYPYSTREVVNIVKHLQRFPEEGLGSVVRNVFDFDAYNKEARDSVLDVLHKHGIPIGTAPTELRLGREFDLPAPQPAGQWEIARGRQRNRFLALPLSTRQVVSSGPQQVTVHADPLDRIEARGVGFSEMQSYWSLQFHDFAVVGDVTVVKDKHNRPFYDTLHVTTANPVWMYTMQPGWEKAQKIGLNQFFGTGRQQVLPRLKTTPLGGKFANGVLAVHDEVSNGLVLVEPASGTVIKLNMQPSDLMDSVRDLTQKLTGVRPGNNKPTPFFRMLDNFAQQGKLLFFTPRHNAIELLDLNGSVDPTAYRIDLPFDIKSLHPLSENQYLLVSQPEEASSSSDQPPHANLTPDTALYLLKTSDPSDPLPTVLNPVSQSEAIAAIHGVAKGGLSETGLKMVLGEAISSPNTLLATEDSFATLVLGFPELEFSANEVYTWPKEKDSSPSHMNSTQYHPIMKKYLDPTRNNIFLKDSCQIVRPVSPMSLPTMYQKNNTGLATPGAIAAYLEVVDLMGGKLRYIPVPEPAQMSVYASWYKQTYPDQIISVAEMSNEGLVTVDNAGTVRLWETGVANLERSLAEWRRMIGGSDDVQLTIDRDQVGEIGSPKHGKIDPTGAPHIGGNTWAGGVGGRDTAGLGGVGGPYRLDAGHDVHQVSDEIKAQVPEHVRKAARDMNRKAFQERLREIKMSEYDAQMYEQYASQVRRQVQSLRMVINNVQAKAKDRQWLKNQTSGELDDTKLIEGITGERAIYKKRGEQDPEPGAPQEKPKRFRLVVDVSGSMYRFNGHDQRLERTLESALMVMEAFEGYEDKFRYDVSGHSGEDADLPFVLLNKRPKNAKDRLEVMRTMHAHAQFCMSGDHTLPATVTAINELANTAEDYDESFVVVLSDANFDRYGIRPENFAKALERNEKVNAYAIFIGSLGDQADRLAKKLPSGKGFVCLDTKKIPEILKTIFTSAMLK